MADIKVGMKVDGLSQFKSAMNQGKQAVKTLDAELKLNAAQYKASGNAEEYMKQKAQLLKQQISEQEKVVKAATDALVKMEENGVKKSSSAYQTMAANVAQAKTRLVEMQQSLNGLGNELSDTGNNARSLGGELADIGNNVSSLNKKDSLSKLSSALGAVEDKAKAVVDGIVNIGKKWWQLEVDASYWADDLLTRATIYEMDTTTLQQWEFAAKKVDTSVESIVSSRQKLMRKLPNEDILARQGGGIIGLGELGDIIYEGETIDDVFWDVLETVGNMDDALTRDKYAQELFGRSWSDLLPLMTAGREEWEAWGKKAPILTPEEVETLGQANDAYETMQDQITALENKVAVGFAPAFQSISESVTNLLGTFATWLDSEQGQAVLNRFTEAVTTFLDSITEEDMQNIVNTLAEGFETALGWISDIIEDIDKIGPLMADAFLVIKGSEGFIALLEFVNTFKSLFGGGNKTPIPNIPNADNGGNPLDDLLEDAGKAGLFKKLLEKAGEASPMLGALAMIIGITEWERGLIDEALNDPEYMAENFGTAVTSDGESLAEVIDEDTGATAGETLASYMAEAIKDNQEGKSHSDELMNNIISLMKSEQFFGEGTGYVSAIDAIELINDIFGHGGSGSMEDLYEGLAINFGEDFADQMLPLIEQAMTATEEGQDGLDSEANAAGEALAGDIVEGASSAAPLMFDSGLSLGAAAVAGFNSAYGGLLGAGGAKPTPSFANGNGPIYNGGNLYVGAMTMNNGMDAAALLGAMNAANRRAASGHGG